MRRRDFVGLVGGAAAWPLAAGAQQRERVRRIGVLSTLGKNDPVVQTRIAALARGLRDLGWMEGRNFRIEHRFLAGRFDLIPSSVADVVASKPDVVHAGNTLIAQEFRRQTRTIPIVFVNVGDPVETGMVATLARPGVNATGFMNSESEIGGKWLELLKEIAPTVSRVLVLVNSGIDTNQNFLRRIEAAAPSLSIQVSSAAIRDGGEIERAIEAFAREPNAGLIALSGGPVSNRRRLIFALAGRYRLPAVFQFREYVTEGGLMSYSADVLDMYRRSASYVDRILKGEKPDDLPVQAPTKYELVVNINAAKAIGLTIPASFLLRVDEVFE